MCVWLSEQQTSPELKNPLRIRQIKHENYFSPLRIPLKDGIFFKSSNHIEEQEINENEDEETETKQIKIEFERTQTDKSVKQTPTHVHIDAMEYYKIKGHPVVEKRELRENADLLFGQCYIGFPKLLQKEIDICNQKDCSFISQAVRNIIFLKEYLG